MSVRSAVVGMMSPITWRMEAQANERSVWFSIDGQCQAIGVRLTPDQARALAHALIIEADVAQFGAPK